MNRSIRTQLVLIFGGVALLTAILFYAFTRLGNETYVRYLVQDREIESMQRLVLDWYVIEGDFDGFHAYFRARINQTQRVSSFGEVDFSSQAPLLPELAQRPPNPPDGEPPPGPPPGAEDGTLRPPPPPGLRADDPTIANSFGLRPMSELNRGRFGIIDADRHVLIPFDGFRPGEYVPDSIFRRAAPVVHEEETVAYIIPTFSLNIGLTPVEEAVFDRNNIMMLYSGLVSVVLACGIGVWLAGRFVQPLDALTDKARQVAIGHYDQRVEIKSQDEFGELAHTFNDMSRALAFVDQNRREMLADIAHDLGTPLTIIYGYTEAVQSGDLELTDRTLETLMFELNYLRRLVGDLNLLSQADSHKLTLKMEFVDTKDFLHKVVHAYAPLVENKDVALITNLQRQLPPIQADPDRLLQVMGNLLNNAIRYTRPNGHIVIGASVEQDDVLLKVRDTGKGISVEELPFIFERFYQSDSTMAQRGKMGLGLAICKALVEAMGGSISAASPPDMQGTVFTITLKAIPAPA